MQRVVYIAGTGRSGSTVLDVILGNHPDVIGCGELVAYIPEQEGPAHPCACGKPANMCSFWSSVQDAYFRAMGSVGGQAFVTARGMGEHQGRWAKLRQCISGESTVHCDGIMALYSAIVQVSGRPVVVDSSKSPIRACNLLKCADLDVVFLHLVRDGRAVLWSRLRDRIRDPPLKRPISRREPLWTILSWSAVNLLVEALGRSVPGKYSVVRYEDLVTYPEPTLRKVSEVCGLDASPLLKQLQAGSPFGAAHQVAGNQGVLTGRDVTLRFDDEWCNALPQRHRWLFAVLGGWVLHRFGY